MRIFHQIGKPIVLALLEMTRVFLDFVYETAIAWKRHNSVLALKCTPCYKFFMPNNPMLEEQIRNAGLAYGRKHDRFYRSGLVTQVFGLALLAVLYPLESPFYTAGIMLFEIGVLLSAIFLIVSIQPIKTIILLSVMIGFTLQIAGYFSASEQNAGTLMISGIGFVCMGASGIVGKEAYCFGYWDGWLLAGIFPVMVLVNLFARENFILNSLGFSVLFLLFLSLTGKKVKQLLMASSCTTNAA